jgi:hypothetical protein
MTNMGVAYRERERLVARVGGAGGGAVSTVIPGVPLVILSLDDVMGVR